MIRTLHDSPFDSTAQRCIELIQKHGPRLMREGGGALERSLPNNGRRMTPAERARVVELRRAGRSIKEVALEVGCSESFVSMLAKRAGIASQRTCFRLSASQVAKIFALRAKGWHHRKIAKAVGCGVATVGKRLRGNWTVRKAA